MKRFFWISLFLFSLMLTSCVAGQEISPSPPAPETAHAEEPTEEMAESLPDLRSAELAAGEKLRVVATTNLVADVVGRVGGDAIELISLLPPGADPHAYQATPNDLRAISDAHLLFINGLGLEESLESLLDEAQAKTVPVNVGVETLTFGDEEHEEEHKEEAEEATHHAGSNPHTWWSIAAVTQWAHNIEETLSAIDPANAEQYTANAVAYRAELAALGVELDELIGQIPATGRKLATDHDTLAYFARDFDFQVVGLIVPSFSSLAEPSAQHLAALQDQIRAENVQAIFVGSTVNPRQAEQLAKDLGIRVVSIFTDSLSEPAGPAPDYLSFMRHNAAAIADALANP